MISHSFAVLAYGNSGYIGDCLESLRAQSIASKIYIATSTPSGYIDAVASRFSVPVYVNHGPTGIAGDWSFAYACCDTDYVTLAHQDDIYLPRFAQRSMEAAEQCRDNLITFTDYFQIQNNETCSWNLNFVIKRLVLLLPFVIRRSWNSVFVKRLIISFGNPICCPAVMYHKRQIGDFRFSAEYTYNLDWDAWIRLAAAEGSFAYINEPLMGHRIHADSETSQQIVSNRRSEEELRCLSRVMPPAMAKLYNKLYKYSELSNRVK